MKKLFLGLSFTALIGIGSSVSIPESVQCNDCGLGQVCTSDYSCGNLGCPSMKCQKSGPYEYQGFCTLR